VDEQAREDFRSYVAARSPALLRTAYMLTGNRADAEDLLQTALAKTYLAWDRIREREAVDGYVRA
jgi:DNA-directed RNA polymerase specialized sigma24 family protein